MNVKYFIINRINKRKTKINELLLARIDYEKASSNEEDKIVERRSKKG